MNTRAKSVRCVFCGDAPVNHKLHYFNTASSLLPTLLFPPKTTSPKRFYQVTYSPLVRGLARWLISLLWILGAVRFSDEPGPTTTSRTKSVWKEAKKRGIRMQELVMFGLRREEMRALLPSKQGAKKLNWEYFNSIPVPPWKNQLGNGWIDDKNTFKRMFQKHDLPVARGAFVRSLAEAKKIFLDIGGRVITKPREGSRARHTTVAISNLRELEEGFVRAKQLCPFVMVEEFIEGTLYRATCVDRKLIGVVQFIKPATVADGVHTVEELRVKHNAHKKFPQLTDVQPDAWFTDAITHQGYTPETILPEGTPLLLSEHSERPNGGYFIDITDAIPEATRATIERAAELCDVEVIGYDIISKDLTDAALRFTFIEGNTLPYIELHDIPFEGTPRNVSGAVFDMWFPKP